MISFRIYNLAKLRTCVWKVDVFPREHCVLLPPLPLLDGPDGEAKLGRPGQGQTLMEGHAALLFQQRAKTFQGVNCLGKHFRRWTPLSDIFFWDPHDITRYFAIWYDYHTILTIFYNSWSVPNLSKNSAKRVICMSNTHNGTNWVHQMCKSGKKYANSC